jgi:hypothetical protein
MLVTNIYKEELTFIKKFSVIELSSRTVVIVSLFWRQLFTFRKEKKKVIGNEKNFFIGYL